MSAAPSIVEPNEIAFFFQTNEPIPTRPLLDFLYEVDRIGHARRHFGPETIIELVEVVTGTKLVRLSIDQGIAVAGVAISAAALGVSIAQFGHDIAERIQQPSGRLAESVARMCLDNGVAECVITTSEGQVRISRDEIAAVPLLRDRRDAEQTRQEPPAKRITAPRDAERLVLDEPALLREAGYVSEALPGRARDGRVYTLIGRLRQPDAESIDWRFTTQSGAIYIARGVDPARVTTSPDSLIVVRAELWGREGGLTVLHIKDVFEPEEP